jgi:hypothetical protein
MISYLLEKEYTDITSTMITTALLVKQKRKTGSTYGTANVPNEKTGADNSLFD